MRQVRRHPARKPRKYRPIVCVEVIEQLGETVDMGEDMPDVLRGLEPPQVGVGMPGGALQLVTVARMWLKSDA